MYYVTNFGGYYADRIRGVWKTPVRLPEVINNGGMDRPSITADNSTLYFSSWRSGGYGQRDLWFSLNSTGVEGGKNLPASPLSFRLSTFPNPFRDRSMITLTLLREDVVRLNIYRLDGRRIHAIGPLKLSSGTHQISWNGCDDRGSLVGPGVYLIRLRTTETILITCLLKLK